MFNSIEFKSTSGVAVFVSDIDADLLEFNWHTILSKKDGSWRVHRSIYLPNPNGRRKLKRSLYLSRQILERVLNRTLQTIELADHIDGNPLNNRRENLRLANKSQNAMNSQIRSDNKSGYRGVRQVKGRSDWRASIAVNGKRIHLGYFDTPEKAALAYKEASAKYFGEFARVYAPAPELEKAS